MMLTTHTTITTLLKTGKYNLENPPHEEIKKIFGLGDQVPPTKGHGKNSLPISSTIYLVE
jgi:hypothetical protein